MSCAAGPGPAPRLIPTDAAASRAADSPAEPVAPDVAGRPFHAVLSPALDPGPAAWIVTSGVDRETPGRVVFDPTGRAAFVTLLPLSAGGMDGAASHPVFSDLGLDRETPARVRIEPHPANGPHTAGNVGVGQL